MTVSGAERWKGRHTSEGGGQDELFGSPTRRNWKPDAANRSSAWD